MKTAPSLVYGDELPVYRVFEIGMVVSLLGFLGALIAGVCFLFARFQRMRKWIHLVVGGWNLLGTGPRDGVVTPPLT